MARVTIEDAFRSIEIRAERCRGEARRTAERARLVNAAVIAAAVLCGVGGTLLPALLELVGRHAGHGLALFLLGLAGLIVSTSRLLGLGDLAVRSREVVDELSALIERRRLEWIGLAGAPDAERLVWLTTYQDALQGVVRREAEQWAKQLRAQLRQLEGNAQPGNGLDNE